MPAFRHPFRGRGFQSRGSFPSYQRGGGGSHGGCGGRGGYGGSLSYRGSPRFRGGPIEGVAFKDTGHPLEDTAEL